MDLTDMLFDGPEDAALTLALAHGAGGPMDGPFMEAVAGGVARRGYRVVRFEFPYMATTRETGKRRPPNRQPVLLDTWREVVDLLTRDAGDARGLLLGGKSMGGRMASLIADEVGARGLVCLGYPFHPPGKPEKTRTEHLETLRAPTLILQGERDPFGKPNEVAGYALSTSIDVRWLPDGDHGFKPRKASGHTEASNLAEAVKAIGDFLDGLRCPPHETSA